MLRTNIKAESAKKQFREFMEGNTRPKTGKILIFHGAEGYDVYNPSIPFSLKGRTVIAARVELRSNEVSKTMFFSLENDAWHLIEDAPVLDLQDPFITFIDGQLWVGGVHVVWKDNGRELIRYATNFYKGNTLKELEFVVSGPEFMKDVRLLQLPDERIAVFSRPQGRANMRVNYNCDCVAKIGFMIIDSVVDLNADVIAKAPLLEGQFIADEWGGANQLYNLKNGLIGVIGHKSWGEQVGDVFEIHYYSMAFALNPLTRELTQTKIISARNCFPDGPKKNARTADVTFTSGIIRLGGGRAQLYAGLNDCQTGMVEIVDPLDVYEKLKTD